MKHAVEFVQVVILVALAALWAGVFAHEVAWLFDFGWHLFE